MPVENLYIYLKKKKKTVYNHTQNTELLSETVKQRKIKTPRFPGKSNPK
jgi:hypothetical protein